ncbi:hypothetical protein CH306_13245 [Rhodococcus sp. 15-725-2-2b]|uniref:hypothetical protein n=1 Tax=unclassified Rhodococcus (in: high G+C Gram-positive bacteria) TaxID=192944 RepID=UPI000B9A2176|nr:MULTISPECIES: hypothetical protein [unclassified Rhodococcus (in: high G+C Gram-positive bacteria)]OZC68560.1 hypothetical protein CH277_11450 [Rhodococcus sp. 06-469-3-2]OZD45237.1 hypothetical protein CH264_12795 [Rhodococcus sp. 06-1477-1A]OZE73092.1 hypothetical protein CH306_13245 [Rhodococcus sp. 15-725-2-2b]
MSAFVRAARFVGDLDDEFYTDELQRDAWNEASAVGFQSLLWIGLVAAAILPYAAGVTGAWIAIGIIVALLTVAFVVIGYARARGVDMYTVQKLRRPRMAIVGVLYLLGFGGVLVRLLVQGGDVGVSTWIGVAAGAALGATAAALGVKGHQRRKHNAELAAEKAELLGFEETDRPH